MIGEDDRRAGVERKNVIVAAESWQRGTTGRWRWCRLVAGVRVVRIVAADVASEQKAVRGPLPHTHANNITMFYTNSPSSILRLHAT